MSRVKKFTLLFFSFFCLSVYAQQWDWAKGGGGTTYDKANSLSTDAAGNLFVTGSFRSPIITFVTIILTNTDTSGNTDDIFIAKYAENGNVLWAKGAGGGSYDVGYSISADKFGNIFITGSFYSTTITFGSTTLINSNTNGYSKQFFIAKYDANGDALWAKSNGGTSEDAGYSVCSDEIGNAFVTGYFSPNYSTITFDSITLTAPQGNCNYGCFPFFIVKYDANGNVLCASALSSSDFNTDVSTDRFGNAYVGGEFHSNPFIIGTDTLPLTGVGNIFVAKYTCNNNTVATNELSNEESISVFPNPSSGIFTINLKNKTVATKICVYDVMGNCLLNKDCRGKGSPTIDLSILPKEIYFMKIVFDGKSVMKKIVLQ